MQYRELRYRPKSLKADVCAARALATLAAIEAIDTGALVYFLESSNVLALGGLRATSPYNVFSPLMTRSRLQRLRSALVARGLRLVPERTHYDDPLGNYTYSLFDEAIMYEIPQSYRAVKPLWVSPLSYSVAGFAEWCFVVERDLAELMCKERLPREWLANWLAPHNLRFGMLLGYPGVAISSALWSEARYTRDRAEDPTTWVEVRKLQPHGASVGFYVADAAATDPEVRQVVLLWDQTLEIVGEHYADLLAHPPAAYADELRALTVWEERYDTKPAG